MLLSANIFQPLIDVFAAVIKFFHDSVGVPWGWSIVLLTVVIRVVLVPLAVKQFHSMQAMQRLQPQLKAMQKKYKDDKQRQQQEMMKLYKENNVNPLGSCLPLVLQLPVLISLFYMLRESLRSDVCPLVQPHHLVKGLSVINKAATVPCGPHNNASFLFISDLTNNATGITLIVLIVAYVGTQMVSTLLMSAPTMDKQQRQLMMLMPLLFVFFVLDFPSGVIVYWITTNLWTMGQQWVMRRRLGSVTAAAEPALAGAGGGGATTGGGRGLFGAVGAVGAGLFGGARGSDASAAGPEPPAPGAARSAVAPTRAREREADQKGAVATKDRTTRGATPPPSPRKKKKRSGRRR
jgi:YidC/Oxa1 family membrane protein insertase